MDRVLELLSRRGQELGNFSVETLEVSIPHPDRVYVHPRLPLRSRW